MVLGVVTEISCEQITYSNEFPSSSTLRWHRLEPVARTRLRYSLSRRRLASSRSASLKYFARRRTLEPLLKQKQNIN
jgi:hypothetical protein